VKRVVDRYRRGRIGEKKIVNDLREKGFENIRRSAGSRGPADIYARKGDNKYYIQVKTGDSRASREEIRELRALARKRRGVAVVIERKGGKNRWRFFGSW
jgi:Holliday junction resolvase